MDWGGSDCHLTKPVPGDAGLSHVGVGAVGASFAGLGFDAVYFWARHMAALLLDQSVSDRTADGFGAGVV